MHKEKERSLKRVTVSDSPRRLQKLFFQKKKIARHRKREREKKKARNFEPPTLRASTFAPSTFSGFGPPSPDPSGRHPSGPTLAQCLYCCCCCLCCFLCCFSLPLLILVFLVRQTAQCFALFSLFCHNVHSFFPLLGILSWNFGGVFEGPGPCVQVWSSLAVV